MVFHSFLFSRRTVSETRTQFIVTESTLIYDVPINAIKKKIHANNTN